MMAAAGPFATIAEQRVVAVLRGLPPEEAVGLARACAAGGVSVIEITMESEGATDSIAALSGSVMVGAGTVRSAEDVDRAHAAGAEFVVSPVVDPRVIERALGLGIPAIPGAMTPSEIELAHRCGADLVKVFPAATLGPGYFREVLSPLSDVKVMATGGIDSSNLASFLEAGATAVGIGSSLAPREAVVERAWDRVVAAVEQIVNAAQEAAARRGGP